MKIELLIGMEEINLLAKRVLEHASTMYLKQDRPINAREALNQANQSFGNKFSFDYNIIQYRDKTNNNLLFGGYMFMEYVEPNGARKQVIIIERPLTATDKSKAKEYLAKDMLIAVPGSQGKEIDVYQTDADVTDNNNKWRDLYRDAISSKGQAPAFKKFVEEFVEGDFTTLSRKETSVVERLGLQAPDVKITYNGVLKSFCSQNDIEFNLNKPFILIDLGVGETITTFFHSLVNIFGFADYTTNFSKACPYYTFRPKKAGGSDVADIMLISFFIELLSLKLKSVSIVSKDKIFANLYEIAKVNNLRFEVVSSLDQVGTSLSI